MQSGEPDTPPLFGTLNDASFIFVALLLVPVALDLHARAKAQTPTWSLITLVIGLVTLPGVAAVQALYVPRVISTALQVPLLTIGLGAMGLWLLLVNWLGRRGTALSGHLSWLGMAVGVCLPKVLPWLVRLMGVLASLPWVVFSFQLLTGQTPSGTNPISLLGYVLVSATMITWAVVLVRGQAHQ